MGQIGPASDSKNDEEQWAERLRPVMGDEDFVREISELAGRDLMPSPRGRPR